MSDYSNANDNQPSDAELEETFKLLQAALATLPSPGEQPESAPQSVVEGARWVHDWLNLDAELARLTHDSSINDSLASVRSTSALRHITFSGGNFEIEIEIEPVERGVSMTGTVTPSTSGTVQAVVGGISHQGPIDDLGTFLIDNVNHGVVMAFISTDSGTIRLGSFEV